jgi:hypothetical protein
MQRGDFVRIQLGSQVIDYGTLLETRHVHYDPPQDGLCAAVEALIFNENDQRAWHPMRHVFLDNRG